MPHYNKTIFAKKTKLIIYLTLLAYPQIVKGIGPSTYDISIKPSGIYGTLERKQTSNESEPSEVFNVFSSAIAVGLNRDFPYKTSTLIQYQIAYNPINQQIFRTGVDIGLNYHFFGDVHRYQHETPYSVEVFSSKKSLSLALRLGMHRYAFGDSSQNIKYYANSVFESKFGLTYRSSKNASSSNGLEFLAVVFDRPDGTGSLDFSGFELSYIYRFVTK